MSKTKPPGTARMKHPKEEGVINLKPVLNRVLKTDLAKVLFPENKFPDMALDRVLKGKTELYASQIRTVSRKYKISYSQLFNL